MIAETDTAGARVGNAITYDPYGQPASWTGPRFGYTGQMRLTATVPLWHYKARAYDPRIGRFLQTDPIGYQDSLNLYAYVGNDPVNLSDPTGMEVKVGSTVERLDDGTTKTIIHIDFTATLSIQGTSLPAGVSLQQVARNIERGIETDFSRSFTDENGNVVEYRTTATIRTGIAQPNDHRLRIVPSGHSVLGNYAGIAPGFENGNTAYLNANTISNGAYLRTAPHEVGHLFGLRHPNPVSENLMTQSNQSSSHFVSRRQLQSIWNNPVFR